MAPLSNPRRAAVVFDVNVYIAAVAAGPRSDFSAWPSPPPASNQPAAECIGIANDAVEFSLFISRHIVRNIVRVLSQPLPDGLDWDRGVVVEYVRSLHRIVDASGGALVTPPERTVHDCEDFEDNRILELADAVDARVIVARDRHLLALNPWRGIPIITPREFVSRVDVMRRFRT